MLAAHRPEPDFRWLDAIAIALFAAGVGGEALADAQLRRFKSKSANRQAVCVAGLWSWSRHPNYFCEWPCWCAVALMAIGPDYPAGWLALLAPIFM